MKYLKLFFLTVIASGLIYAVEFDFKPAFSQGKANIACAQYPSGIDTPSVKDSKFIDQDAYKKEGATWEYRWEADCSQGCSKNSDCTANTANAPAVATGTSAWCFEFTDGNRCMILTTTDKPVGEDKNKSGGKFGQGGAKSGQPGSGGGKVCKESMKTSYYDAKVANNLVRYYAIINGIPGLCVPADLGTSPPDLTEDGRRLLLCSGEAKEDESQLPDLVWRVPNSANTSVEAVAGKTDPSRDTIGIALKDRINKARKAAGLLPKE